LRLEARIIRDPDYTVVKVEANARETLREHFSFDARSLNQPVTLSEVVATIQGAEGVVAVTITLLALSASGTSSSPPVPEMLTASQPGGASTQDAQPAWLLTIDPTTLGEVKVIA
jgi:hypothetical protein